MISILATSISIVADATYKIIIEGFPVLTVGTTDKDRHFIPFGCVVSTGEAENDFKFLFDSLKEGLKMIDPSFIYSPKHLIADNAGAIHNELNIEQWRLTT